MGIQQFLLRKLIFNMIVVKIYGGLAGQMLQYSVGRHLSIINKTSLYLDLEWYENKENQQDLYPRLFNLNEFQTKFKIYNKNNLKIRFVNFLNIFEFIKENDFSTFDSSILTKGSNIYLDGYFNSHHYFEKIRSVLVEDFKLKNELDKTNLSLLEVIKSNNSVCIHIRRGDYALSDFHGILDNEYYYKAISIILNRVSNPYFFVFSDDIFWVKNEFSKLLISLNLNYNIVDLNDDLSNFKDMELMKNCSHFILANSSFGWWPAYLSNNDGLRVAPIRWINSNKVMDNIPDEWILL